MDGPHAIVIDRRGRMYVGDRGNYRIKVFDENGKLLDIWPELPATALSIDAKDRLWVVCSIGRGAATGLVEDTGREDCGLNKPDHAISAIDLNSGKTLFSWAAGGEGPNQLYGPVSSTSTVPAICTSQSYGEDGFEYSNRRMAQTRLISLRARCTDPRAVD